MDEPPQSERQHGAFTRRQAAEAGFARSTVRRRIGSGRWVPLLAGAYVARDRVVTTRTRAWAAHLVTGGIVSHRTAGVLHGVRPDALPQVDVVSKRGLHVAADGVLEHRVRLGADEWTRSDGLPITTRLRTVVDLVSTLPEGDAVGFLFRAVQQGWLDESVIRHQIGRRRHMTGNQQLRRMAELLGTGAHSPAELALHRILEGMLSLDFRANVPIRVGGANYVVDVLLPQHRIVIEVDGRAFHSSTKQFVSDRRRQNALTGAGYLVLRFTWIDLIEQPGRVAAEVSRAISVRDGANVARTGP